MAIKTSEQIKIIALGERLRENPKTILLSVPVLGLPALWFSLMGNKPALAVACGHLGLTFRLYYKHHCQCKVFLKWAYSLLNKAAKIGTGEGQPTIRMVMGSVALDMGNKDQAYADYQKAYEMAKKQKDINQTAFMQSHLGRIKIQLDDLPGAKKDLETALKTLSLASEKDLESMYLHIWASNAEIGLSEWFLASGNKKQAKAWAEKVASRAEKYDLKTRKLDAENLFKKIAA